MASVDEARRILRQILKHHPRKSNALVPELKEQLQNVYFKSSRDLPYFPTPFKETETVSALKLSKE